MKRPSQRFLSNDKTSRREPLGRFGIGTFLAWQRPEGFILATGFVQASLRDENKPSGRCTLLTDPKLRSQVDALWDKFWTGGLANPLDAIEQFSYLPYTVPEVLGASRRLGRKLESRGKNLRDGKTFGTFLAGNHAISW